MAIIRADCPECGFDVELTPRDVKVITDRATRIQTVYRFLCPDHGGIVTKSAEPRIIDLLVASGVAIESFDSEPLANEASERHRVEEANGPLTHDELLDLGLASLAALDTARKHEIYLEEIDIPLPFEADITISFASPEDAAQQPENPEGQLAFFQ